MNRLKSLDVMRGLTVALMILVNNGGEHNYSFLEHSKWNGLTPCDLVFPFFLFMMGMSTFLSLKKTEFKPSAAIYRKIAKRTILLFLIGLGINWFDMICNGGGLDFAHLRIWAVLQRIALWHGLGDEAATAAAVIDLWIVLGKLGQELRTRMLRKHYTALDTLDLGLYLSERLHHGLDRHDPRIALPDTVLPRPVAGNRAFLREVSLSPAGRP